MKIFRRFKLWLTETKLYSWALYNFIPYIRLTTYYTSMQGKVYHKLYEKLKPGHIILTLDKKKLTSFLIPGTFSHAGLCISKDQEWECSEMTHLDYTKSAFADMCFQSDRVVILECTEWDEEYTNKIIERCKDLDGTKYDIKFELGIKALSCAELVYEADYERRLTVSLEDVAGLGRLYISPDGLFKADNVIIVADSNWYK